MTDIPEYKGPPWLALLVFATAVVAIIALWERSNRNDCVRHVCPAGARAELLRNAGCVCVWRPQ